MELLFRVSMDARVSNANKSYLAPQHFSLASIKSMFYLRALSIILHSLIKNKPSSAHSIARIELRVWMNEADLTFVNNATYLQYFELGRIDLMLRGGFFWPSIREKLFVPMRGLHIDFRRPLRRFQNFSVTTRILSWDDQNIYVIQGIHSKGKTIALAFLNSVIKSGRETLPPATLLQRFHWKVEDSAELRSFCQNFRGSTDDYNRIDELLRL